jgi:diguanylate cyclase (GGDEF)-like protein
MVGRVGGDEFVIWLDGVAPGAIEREAKMLHDAAKPLLAYSARPDLPFTFSVGAALIEAVSALSADALLKRADAAMYEVKRAGKGRHAIVTGSGESVP